MAKYRIWLLLVVTNLFWAGNYVFGKYVIMEVSPLWITFSRWLLALFFLFPIAYFVEKPDWQKAVKSNWLALIGMAILGVAGYNLVLYSALEYTTATNAALVSALNPGVIVLFSVFLLKENISRIQVTGFIVSLIGALVILTQGNIGKLIQLEVNKGDLLMIAAVLMWTFYSIIGKKLTMPPITATAVSSLFGTVILAPLAIAQGIEIEKVTMLGASGILYMAIFASVCSFVLWNVCVRAIGASQAGIFLNLIPFFTAIISGILGEKIMVAQVIGGVLVFFGVYLTTGMLNRKKDILSSVSKS
ncbi:DMT family transporter [Brevibacillus dissolubilis]|uniref:DMT family transporter n=1 Tax=Brevibacillus dissolubilis TaxID=1844116 RepID=UPI0011166150|nr:DMT family transporter [Brevibacillus dissolubilis]